MIYFNKILPVIFSPLGLLIFLLIYGILRKKRLPLVIASILVIVFSLPLVSNKLTQLLEQLNQLSIKVLRMKNKANRLEEIFLRLTDHEK